jgi:uncharacterized protein YodC (DUF2158 family)
MEKLVRREDHQTGRRIREGGEVMEEKLIRNGDKVRHKSGGPVMVVIGGGFEVGSAKCQRWVEGLLGVGGQFVEYEFLYHSLEVVEDMGDDNRKAKNA